MAFGAASVSPGCETFLNTGMGDVTIFRYAKKWYYGFASAFGCLWFAAASLDLGSRHPGIVLRRSAVASQSALIHPETDGTMCQMRGR
jgi:hypothetical protein